MPFNGDFDVDGNIVGLFGAMVLAQGCGGWFLKLYSAVDGSCCIGQIFTSICLNRASCGGFRCVSTAPPGEVSLVHLLLALLVNRL